MAKVIFVTFMAYFSLKTPLLFSIEGGEGLLNK
jgi:hypothetical protein